MESRKERINEKRAMAIMGCREGMFLKHQEGDWKACDIGKIKQWVF